MAKSRANERRAELARAMPSAVEIIQSRGTPRPYLRYSPVGVSFKSHGGGGLDGADDVTGTKQGEIGHDDDAHIEQQPRQW